LPTDAGAAEPHFINECFFLTGYALHIGFMRTVQTYDNLLKVRGTG
jgi:hypothetical protein